MGIAGAGIAGGGASLGLSALTMANPAAGVAGTILGSALPGLMTGGKTNLSTSGDISDRSVINVCPVGVNLGEILRPYNEGAYSNGGFGLETASRYVPAALYPNETLSVSTPLGGVSVPTIAAVIAGIVLLFFFLRGK